MDLVKITLYFMFILLNGSELKTGDTLQIKDFKFYEINESIKNSKINKKSQFKTFELSEIDNSSAEETGAEIIQKHNATWLKVFYHNSKSGTVLFLNNAEALHCETVDKFSVLDELENFRGKDGKFEFLLEYPDDYPNEYNRWKQIDNPATVQDVAVSDPDSVQVNGYEEIHIDWNGRFWNGLRLSTNTYTLIDGSIGSDYWWYAIGANRTHTNGNDETGIPGPSLVPGKGTNIDSTPVIGRINLYVRLDNIDNNFNEFKLFKRQVQTKEIKEI